MAKTTSKKAKETELQTLLKKLNPAKVRFTYLYMGGEDGKCFNNATLSYIRAYEIETSLTKDKDGKYSTEYLSAKQCGYKLLTSIDIQRLRHILLLESGFDPDTIKKRYAELAYQNKNLPIALTATDRIGKITGVIKEDKTSVDIPQLQELTDHIKAILTP